MNDQIIIKVLIADDSMLMRVIIKDVLKEFSDIEVIGNANNGQDAYLKTQQLRPDVVLMDLVMGEFDGLFGIQQIMQHCPTPILVLSAVGNNDMDTIMEALHGGAVDYLNKPAKNNTNLHEIGNELIDKIRQVAKAGINPIKSKHKESNLHLHAFEEVIGYDIIIIGASTGGPTAIEAILTQLPANLPVPVLIAQHMPQNFIVSFAQRLNKITSLEVKVAEKGDEPRAGCILLSPCDRNMLLKTENGKVVVDFTLRKYKAYNFPSVDSIMLSAAEIYGRRCIGVILTGMGSDGASGMQSIFESGGYTIAQSPDTCVVYGMPRVAIENKAIRTVVKINEIGAFLVSCLS